MSIKIQVDPARLDTAAGQIDQQTLSYEKNYRRLFQDGAAAGRERIIRPLYHRFRALKKTFSKWLHSCVNTQPF